METGKELDSYTGSAGICELDPGDMEQLGVKEGETIRVRTAAGEVVVKAVKSTQEPHPGVAFIPLGPWASAVVDPDTTSTGMPSLKGVKATVEAAKGEKVLSAVELVRQRYRKV